MHCIMGKARPAVSLASFALLLSFSTGCGTGSSPQQPPGNPSNPSPSSPGEFNVTAVQPASGAANVATNSTVQITFSGAANASTVNAADITLTGSSAVAGTVSYNAGNNTATFTPSAALANSTKYTVTVSGVTSSGGTALATAFTSSFTTVASSGSGATTQYSAPLFATSAGPGSQTSGQISIDSSGNVTVQLTGATASTSYSVQFCPAFNSIFATSVPSCINVGTVSTNASGSGNLTAMFPQPGQWAGDFNLNIGSTTAYQTTLFPGVSSESYLSTLQPQSTVNGIGVTLKSPQGQAYTNQEPLNSGSITYSDNAIQFAVNGTASDLSFLTVESENVYLYGSGTYQCDTFTTNAQGDATATVTTTNTSLCGPVGDLLQAYPANDGSSNTSDTGAGFIGGFSVPQ
jgi:hypothetical protein